MWADSIILRERVHGWRREKWFSGPHPNPTQFSGCCMFLQAENLWLNTMINSLQHRPYIYCYGGGSVGLFFNYHNYFVIHSIMWPSSETAWTWRGILFHSMTVVHQMWQFWMQPRPRCQIRHRKTIHKPFVAPGDRHCMNYLYKQQQLSCHSKIG